MKFYAACLLAMGVAGLKKSYPDELRATRTPKVGAKCDALCIFDKKPYDSWCFETTPPMLKIGWEWAQVYTKTLTSDPIKDMDYYRWDFIPYVDTQVYLQSIFQIQNLYFNEFVAELARFKTNIFMALTVNAKFYICPGMGWSTEAIELTMTMQQKLMDCYKTILEDLCDFTDSWTGYEAKWFEECNLSNNAQIVLLEESFSKKKTDVLWAGTVDPWSILYCKPLPLVSTKYSLSGGEPNSSIFAKAAYKQILDYLSAHY